MSYQYQLPVRQLPPPRPTALPEQPRDYQQMLRGPLHRWWSPILSLLVVVAIAIPIMIAALLPVVLIGALVDVANPLQWTFTTVSDVSRIGPVAFLYVNLSLIALIPAAGLSIWIGHQIRPRYLSSVVGGIRWGWLMRCMLLALPVWLAYIGLSVIFEAPQGPRPEHWMLLLVMVFVLTPFQAAAEEYLFRGWILQNVGSWFAQPIVGLVVSIIVSTTAFAAAHLSPDPWIIGSLACLSVASGVAAWRTGGLEAGIAMHTVNNVTAFTIVILFGGWEQAFITPTSNASPAVFVLALIVHGSALVLILWQAKRKGIQRRFQPSARPLLDGGEQPAAVGWQAPSAQPPTAS
jgi:membrane protease YdiL (CAAX protease family)